MLSFFPRDVLDEIWDLIVSVSEDFPTYSSNAKRDSVFFLYISFSFAQNTTKFS